jgi:dipeptidyl aminopeptidase/acylaminoacyl peptidase
MTKKTLSLERFISLHRVSAVTASPDGSWLAAAVSRLDPDKTKYISDLWKIPTDGSAPSQLTWGRYNDRAPNFRQDGSLAFLSNRTPREGKPEEGDEERTQVFILPVQGGEPMPITDEPLGVLAFRFSGDTLIIQANVLVGVLHEEQRKKSQENKKGSSALYYTKTPIRFWDHWLPKEVTHLIRYSSEGKDRKDLTPFIEKSFALDWFFWDVSRDGSAVICTVPRETEDRMSTSDLILIDTKTAESRTLLAGQKTEGFSDVKFSPDKKTIAYTRGEPTKEALGLTELWTISVESGDKKQISLSIDIAPHLMSFSPNGKTLLCNASYFGDMPAFLIKLSSGEVTRLTKDGCYEGIQWTSQGQLVGLHHTYFHPAEAFIHTGKPNEDGKLLACLSGFSDEEGKGLVRMEHVVVAAPDGGHVRGFVVAPKEGKHFPTLLWIHGGPISAHHNGWHWRWNALLMASNGYAVALPNPRGSTGYGQEFIEGIWKNQWGAACYRDLMAFTEALEKHPWCHEENIAAMGGSFGGYMANWIGGQNKRFKCLVSHAGLYHLDMFYGTTDGPIWFALEMGTSPLENKEAFEKYSPHKFISQWKTPVLVIHGEKDYRVPVSEALYLFEALQHHRVPSELMIFPDENHWILKPQNAKAWYQAVYDFLAKYM